MQELEVVEDFLLPWLVRCACNPLVRISQVACWEVSGKTVLASCPVAVRAALSELLRGGSVYPLQFIAAGKPQWLVLEEMQSGTESHDCMHASPLPAQGMVLPTAGPPISSNAIDETPLNMPG